MATYIKRSASFSSADRFFFPSNLKCIPFDGRCVVLSPETANWLVVDNSDLCLFERFNAGESIGAIAKWSKQHALFERLQLLIAQIVSRKFASTTEPPRAIADKSIKEAYFYLTNACNLRCSHCYMFSGKTETGELNVNEWIHLVHEFADLGGSNITFSGGEVLTKHGWTDIIENASKRNISSTILTNGTLWTSEIIKKIVPHITEVQISIDGPTEQINAITRGKGGFIKALQTAKAFYQEGVRTSIAMTPTPETINSFEGEFIDFFNEYISGTSINIRISQKLLSGRKFGILSNQEREQYEEITQRLANIIYPKYALRAFVLGHKPNELQPNCGFGGISISSIGDVYPCNRISDVHLVGNIRSKKLAQLMPLLYEAGNATNVDNIFPCKYCDLRYICGGGCRIDEYDIFLSNGRKISFGDFKAQGQYKIEKLKCTEDYKISLIKKMVNLKEYIFEK